MILTNEIPVSAPPEVVFALINDVERVVTCLPGAAIDGVDPDGAYQGRVKVKVGPISAAYSGVIRFRDVDAENHRLRMHGRGADTHGNGDAEAEVDVSVEAAPGGSVLRLHTDLVIRGKIAQFGKGAIGTVSNKILQQFAGNLAVLIEQDRAGVPAQTGPAAPHQPTLATAPAPAPASAGAAELDGLAMLLGPAATRYLQFGAVFTAGLVQGWLLGKLRTQGKQIKELRRG